MTGGTFELDLGCFLEKFGTDVATETPVHLEIPTTVGPFYNHVQLSGFGAIVDFILSKNQREVPVFMDLGSGIGAAVLYFSSRASHSVSYGVEYFSQRVGLSREIERQLRRGYPDTMGRVEFFCGDFLAVQRRRILGANIIWSYDRAYSPRDTIPEMISLLSTSAELDFLVSFVKPSEINSYATGRRFKKLASFTTLNIAAERKDCYVYSF